MGTATTNASGVATKSYSSSGVGDVSFSAEVGSLVSETYTIHDYVFVDAMTSASGHWTYQSAMSPSYSSNGATISANSWSNNAMSLDTSITPSHSIEFEIKSISFTFYFNFNENDEGKFTGEIATDKSVWNNTSYSGKGSSGKYLFKFYSDKVEVYRNDELFHTTNMTVPSSLDFVIYGGPSRNMTIKDVIIKPL